MTTHRLAARYEAVSSGSYLPILLGSTGALLAMVTAVAPWTLAVWAGIGIFCLAFTENEALILAALFLLPLNVMLKQDVWIRDLSIAVHTLILAGFFVGRFCRDRLGMASLLRLPVSKASVFLVAAFAVSAIFGLADQRHAEIRGVYFLSVYVGFYFLMLVWLDTAEKLCKMAWTVLLSFLPVAGFAVLQVLIGGFSSFFFLCYPEAAGGDWEGRPAAFFPHPNSLAVYCSFCLCLAFASFRHGPSGKWRSLSTAVMVAGIFTLLLTQSRGAFLAMVCVGLLSVWYFTKRWQTRALWIVGILIAASLVQLLATQLDPKRYGLSEDNSVYTRFILWGVALQLFESSPVHGVGIGTFQLINEQYIPDLPQIPKNLEAHNVYIELLAETGVIGFAGYLALLGVAFRAARTQLGAGRWISRVMGYWALASTLTIAIASFFDHSLLWAAQDGLMFWTILAALAATIRCAGAGLPEATPERAAVV